MPGAARVYYQNGAQNILEKLQMYQEKVIIIYQGLEELTIKTSTGDLRGTTK